MQRLRLVDHVLQSQGICDQFVVSDGFFLVCRVV